MYALTDTRLELAMHNTQIANQIFLLVNHWTSLFSRIKRISLKNMLKIKES